MSYETIPDWMSRMFGRVDNRDPEGFAAHFAPDGIVRFANNPPVAGRDGIVQFANGFFEMIAGIRHDFKRAYVPDGSEVLEGMVTYFRKDGREVGPLPFCSVFDMRGSEIAEYRAYVDTSPLFAD